MKEGTFTNEGEQGHSEMNVKCAFENEIQKNDYLKMRKIIQK